MHQEAFIEECELIRSDVLENELVVEGQFLTPEQMRDDWGFSP